MTRFQSPTARATAELFAAQAKARADAETQAIFQRTLNAERMNVMEKVLALNDIELRDAQMNHGLVESFKKQAQAALSMSFAEIWMTRFNLAIQRDIPIHHWTGRVEHLPAPGTGNVWETLDAIEKTHALTYAPDLAESIHATVKRAMKHSIPVEREPPPGPAETESMAKDFAREIAKTLRKSRRGDFANQEGNADRHRGPDPMIRNILAKSHALHVAILLLRSDEIDKTKMMGIIYLSSQTSCGPSGRSTSCGQIPVKPQNMRFGYSGI